MLLLTVTLTSCGPTREDYVSFNDELVSYQLELINAINDLEATFEEYKEEEMWVALDNLNSAGKKCRAGIADLNIEGGDELKQSLTDLNDYILHATKNILIDMVKNLSIPDDDYTDEDKAAYGLMYDEYDAKARLLIQEFLDQQEVMADANNFYIES